MPLLFQSVKRAANRQDLNLDNGDRSDLAVPKNYENMMV